MLHSRALPDTDQLKQLQSTYTTSAIAARSETSYHTYINHYGRISNHYSETAFPPTVQSLRTFFTAGQGPPGLHKLRNASRQSRYQVGDPAQGTLVVDGS